MGCTRRTRRRRATPIGKCVILVKLTANGFIYDKDATKPDTGPYNCSDENVKSVKTYQ